MTGAMTFMTNRAINAAGKNRMIQSSGTFRPRDRLRSQQPAGPKIITVCGNRTNSRMSIRAGGVRCGFHERALAERLFQHLQPRRRVRVLQIGPTEVTADEAAEKVAVAEVVVVERTKMTPTKEAAVVERTEMTAVKEAVVAEMVAKTAMKTIITEVDPAAVRTEGPEAQVPVEGM